MAPANMVDDRDYESHPGQISYSPSVRQRPAAGGPAHLGKKQRYPEGDRYGTNYACHCGKGLNLLLGNKLLDAADAGKRRAHANHDGIDHGQGCQHRQCHQQVSWSTPAQRKLDHVAEQRPGKSGKKIGQPVCAAVPQKADDVRQFDLSLSLGGPVAFVQVDLLRVGAGAGQGQFDPLQYRGAHSHLAKFGRRNRQRRTGVRGCADQPLRQLLQGFKRHLLAHAVDDPDRSLLGCARRTDGHLRSHFLGGVRDFSRSGRQRK